jgi:hypothetical protein
VLAQGPAGPIKPIGPAPLSEAKIKADSISIEPATAAEAAPATGAASPVSETVSALAAAPKEVAVVEDASAEEAPATSASGQVLPAAESATMPGTSRGTWVAAGLGAFLLAGWGIAVGVNHRLRRRR